MAKKKALPPQDNLLKKLKEIIHQNKVRGERSCGGEKKKGRPGKSPGRLRKKKSTKEKPQKGNKRIRRALESIMSAKKTSAFKATKKKNPSGRTLRTKPWEKGGVEEKTPGM